MRKIGVLVLLSLVVGLILGSLGCGAESPRAASGSAASGGTGPDPELPAFAYNSATALAAYKLAPRLAGVLPKIPCYCDCGRASNHKSLKDCYFKEDGSFNDHASNCDICQDEILDVDKWQREGKSVREIRAAIDEKYKEYGRPTDTPPVE